MRLFIACEAESIAGELSKAQKLLPDARMTFPKHFHLTLKFLGEVSPDKAEKIKLLLDNVEFDAFELCLQPLEVFDPNNVRVVWVGLKPEQPLNALAAQVDKTLAGLFPPNDHFKPHLTIARVKFLKSREEFIKKVQEIKVKELCFAVDKFYLIESKLTPKGPEYAVLREYFSK